MWLSPSMVFPLKIRRHMSRTNQSVLLSSHLILRPALKTVLLVWRCQWGRKKRAARRRKPPPHSSTWTSTPLTREFTWTWAFWLISCWLLSVIRLKIYNTVCVVQHLHFEQGSAEEAEQAVAPECSLTVSIAVVASVTCLTALEENNRTVICTLCSVRSREEWKMFLSAGFSLSELWNIKSSIFVLYILPFLLSGVFKIQVINFFYVYKNVKLLIIFSW